MQAGKERSAGCDLRVTGFRSQAENRSERHVRAMRPTNDRALLSFAGPASLLPGVFPRRTNHDRDRVISARKTPFSHVPLMFQVIRNISHHDATFEEQRSFYEECVLVVQEILPPSRGHKLWQHDCDYFAVRAALDAIDVVEQGPQQRTIGRSYHDQIYS